MYRPARHRSQDRQGMRISTATRSPALTPQRAAGDGAISSMIPSGSWAGGPHRPLVLLDVGAADAAGLDAQQGAVVGADHRPGELADLHLPRPRLDHGPHHVSHTRPIRLPASPFPSAGRARIIW